MLMTLFSLQNGGNSLLKNTQLHHYYFKISKHWIRLILISKIKLKSCCNPSLGLMTKARACKGVGQEGSPRITSHVPGSVGECEEINLHIPK